MRNQPTAITEVLEAATSDSLVIRKAIWIEARNRSTGLPEGVGVWSGDEDIGLTVIEGREGLTVTRPYYGSGNLLTVSDIPLVSDFTVQTVTIDLSQIADVARKVTREYDVHRAYVEIHEILLDPVTGRPVAPDEAIFIGIVDGAPHKTPSIGGSGKASLKVVSEVMAMLTRTSAEKASYEAQKLRDNDELNLYAGQVETWDISWGQA